MASPSYRKVCNDRDFSDYAETIRVEFDAAKLPYDDLLDSFFNAHDATARGKSRQYASVVFRPRRGAARVGPREQVELVPVGASLYDF